MQTKTSKTRFDLIVHAGYTIIKKTIGKNTLEVDTRRPRTVYLNYGWYNGEGPWHSTSGIHYGDNKFGFDCPSVWNKKTRAVLPALFAMVEKITSLK